MDAHIPVRPVFCDRHQGDQVTGFCASCLRERLVGLDNAGATDPPRKSNSSVLKSIFLRSTSSIVAVSRPSSVNNPLLSSFQLSELRRCKSLSASVGVAEVATVEPKRKSCDVRVRSTLWSLFRQDASCVGGRDDFVYDCRTVGFPRSLSLPEEEDIRENNDEIAEEKLEEEKVSPLAEMKTMKDHIDFESYTKKTQAKDLKEIAGSFWLSASVFSQKLLNWRRKQKLEKKPPSASPPEKNNIYSQRFCDQSEIAVNAFGRRSFDVDPRSSLDASRFSVGGHRYLWDEPRASCDGHLISSRSAHPRLPFMLPVASAAAAIKRFDCEVPLVQDWIPGGTSQTRDYYNTRRLSLDRSNTSRKQSLETSDISQTANEPIGSYSESFNSGCRVQLPKAPPLTKSERCSVRGLIPRRSGGSVTANGAERGNGCNGRLRGSHRRVPGYAGFGRTWKNALKANGFRKEEFSLERNPSLRYSSYFDIGLLRFSLPPLKGGRSKEPRVARHCFN